MLRTVVRRFYRVRYFPRLLLQLLGDIAQDTGTLSSELRALQDKRIAGQRTLADIQTEIGFLCDDVTRLIIQERRRSASATTGMLQVEQNMHRLETALEGVTKALNADIAERRAELAAFRDATERLTGAMVGGGRGVVELSEALATQAARIASLDRAVRQHIQTFPSWLWSTDAARQVRETLSLLRPVAVTDRAKTRLGRDSDGGYVMLDDFEGIGAALSLGIADDVSWDLDVAARGIRVLQFDPTVPASPTAHPLFEFQPLRVVPDEQQGGVTVDDIVHRQLGSVRAPLLLKIDIEGSEWDVLDTLGDDTLRRFRQVVCEFHDLDRLAEPEFGARARKVWSKLASTHHLVHVHGNNCGNFANVANTIVPQSLEVTYASREYYAMSGDAGTFPTALDRPNEPGRADLYLGDFHFGVEDAETLSTGHDGAAV